MYCFWGSSDSRGDWVFAFPCYSLGQEIHLRTAQPSTNLTLQCCVAQVGAGLGATGRERGQCDMVETETVPRRFLVPQAPPLYPETPSLGNSFLSSVGN